MSRLIRFDAREKTGLFAAVALVWLAANLAALFLVIMPRIHRVEGLAEAGRTVNESLSRRKRKVETLGADFDRVMNGRTHLQTFYDDVLSTKRLRMTPVQQEIREIAARYNIKPESITYSREIFEDNRIVKFTSILPLTGSYENLRAFLASLEVSKNFLIIESVAIADSREGGVILGLNVAVATYFLDPDLVTRRERAARGL